MMKLKQLIPFALLLTLWMLSSCDFIGDRNYDISELKGVYVIRNYFEDGGSLGPKTNDTLFICNGNYKNRYFGEGKAEIDRQRTNTIILFRYAGSLGKKHAAGYHIDKRPFGNLRLTISSDLNYYYERISKECPDVLINK